MDYRRLLEPGKIGRLEIKNRIVMPAMGTNLAAYDGTVTDAIVAYYERRARGGVGLIITEVCAPEPRGKVIPGELEISELGFIPGLSRLVGAAHSGGAKIALQLAHGGCFAAESVTGHVPISPSGVKTALLPDDHPEVMTVDQIKDLIRKYALAAEKGKISGFDAIELHGAHGYMPLQFLSGYTNKRTDEYGGSLENRARFALETIRAIKKSVGAEFPLIYRLSAYEDVPGGLELNETTQFARWAQEAGADAIHVSAGTWDSRISDFANVMNGKDTPKGKSLSHGICTGMWVPPLYVPRGNLVRFAYEVKKHVDIPILAVCGLSPEIAEEVIGDRKADFAAMGRQIIADPDYPAKLSRGKPEEIRRCVRCNECLGSVLSYNGLKCGVNPEAGREHENYVKVYPAERKKNVSVVGGGPAGMEAARVASQRGHRVTLYERSRELGGMLRYLSRPAFKNDYQGLLKWQITELSRHRVNVVKGVEVTTESLLADRPDTVIVATGASLARPPIEGIDGDFIDNPLDVLHGKIPAGKHVIVCGAGLFGTELAIFLAEEHSKQVTLIDMLPEVVPEVEFFSQMVVKAKLAELGVVVNTGYLIRKIESSDANGRKKVICESKGEVQTTEGDAVIVALGMTSDRNLYDELLKTGIETIIVGDVDKPRKIINAIHEGYHAGRRI